MNIKSTVPMMAAAASMLFASICHSATYTETGDAGDLPSTAQVVSGPAGTPLTAISGATTLTNNTSDSDMFEIYINSPSTFSASMTAFIAGQNNFDSQLSLFSVATAQGVVSDDDDPVSGASQANIPAGSLGASSLAGYYFLVISGSGRYATGSSGLIFPNFTDGMTDPTVVQGPTGPGGSSAINGYTGTSNEGGNYTIVLNGAQFVPSAIPEPRAYAYLLAGAAGLVIITHARRNRTDRLQERAVG